MSSSNDSNDDPLQIGVYISGHGLGHYMRTINLLEILSTTGKHKFHIRTTTSWHSGHLKYPLQPAIYQNTEYSIDAEKSLQALHDFDISDPAARETEFLVENKIQVILSDAPWIACIVAQSLQIPCILVTNFTFDSIYQHILSMAPSHIDGKIYQVKIDEISRAYGLAQAVIRLPGAIPFLFKGPKIIDSPMHFRAAKLNRSETLAALGLQHLSEKRILLQSFGGHNSSLAATTLPKLPENWVCLSQTIDSPPNFYKIPKDVYVPDVINASDAVLGKLGWGTCSELIGNGVKPFIYVPRKEFAEEVGLLEWMKERHRRIVRLDVETYESLDWRKAIAEAETMGLQEVGGEGVGMKNDAIWNQVFDSTIRDVLVTMGGK